MGVVPTPKPNKKPKVNKTPKPSTSKMLKTPVSVATPAALSEAKKVLKKARQMKQMDLKKSLVKKVDKKPLTEADLIELRRKAEEKRLHRLAEKEAEKERRREERIKRVQEKREMRRLEKLRKIEWMKPREDLLCEDSKVIIGVWKGGERRESNNRLRERNSKGGVCVREVERERKGGMGKS